MLAELGQVHAGVAVHAVAHVDAQATPQPAQVAEGTVVDAAPLLIIMQMADVAVVARQALLTVMAVSCTVHKLVKCHLLTLSLAPCDAQVPPKWSHSANKSTTESCGAL